jgi:hypothetical protein
MFSFTSSRSLLHAALIVVLALGGAACTGAAAQAPDAASTQQASEAGNAPAPAKTITAAPMATEGPAPAHPGRPKAPPTTHAAPASAFPQYAVGDCVHFVQDGLTQTLKPAQCSAKAADAKVLRVEPTEFSCPKSSDRSFTRTTTVGGISTTQALCLKTLTDPAVDGRIAVGSCLRLTPGLAKTQVNVRERPCDSGRVTDRVIGAAKTLAACPQRTDSSIGMSLTEIQRRGRLGVWCLTKG